MPQKEKYLFSFPAELHQAGLNKGCCAALMSVITVRLEPGQYTMLHQNNTKINSRPEKRLEGRSCLLQSRDGRADQKRMTKGKAVTVLGLSERNVSCLILSSADLLTAFRREISVVQVGGRSERGYSIEDFHLAYQTLLTRMKNNKLKLRKERRK